MRRRSCCGLASWLHVGRLVQDQPAKRSAPGLNWPTPKLRAGPPTAMTDFQRPSGRTPAQLRDVSITRGYTRHAEGSVLVAFGGTRVLCTASVENRVPGFLRSESTRLNSSH